MFCNPSMAATTMSWNFQEIPFPFIAILESHDKHSVKPFVSSCKLPCLHGFVCTRRDTIDAIDLSYG